jgi:transposase-like protein
VALPEADMGESLNPQETVTESNDKPPIPKELIDQLLKGYQSPQDLLGEDGLFKRLTAALVNRAMEAELSHHLGYEPGQTAPEGQPNRRNGKGRKRVRTDQGPIEIEVPRDRASTFEPQLVKKHQRHFDGFDDKIVSMYARGMSTREIQAHLQEIYGVEVSPDLVSSATAAVIDELEAWQRRPLDAVYPVVYLDALVVKIRDKGVVQNKSVYLVVGVGADGTKTVLGMWLQNTEGAKFWLAILEELRQRGVQDVFVLCADGLSGLPQAVEAAFPRTIFQTCIVHMIRSSTRLVPWKDRRELCADLREIYTAADQEHARVALDAFEAKWGHRFPSIGKAWHARWAEITPFLSFPAEIRRAIYTTNAIEALNRQIRKTLKTRGHMPTDDAALKLVYLAIRNAERSWGGTDRHTWAQARLQFAIYFGDRFPT